MRTAGMLLRSPDPVVFGDWSASPDYGSLTVLCPRCDVRQSLSAGRDCWYCGGQT